jgi:CelD/BcsL family acetyltransferase involved in cellulose biosynthesis
VPETREAVELDSIDAARDVWERVAQRQDNVFATWEWAAAWWRVYGGGREQLLHAVLDPDGQVGALLPVYLARRGPVRVARFIGLGPADQLGPVCAAESRRAAADGLRTLVADHLGARGFLLAERLRGDEGWEGLLRARPVNRRSFPVLGLERRDYDGWLATKSSNFRQQAGRRERKLVRERALRFRLVTAGP